MECCQDQIYIWSVSTVFPGTLGRGNIDPVMGKHPLEFSFNSIFPSFGDPYILKADDDKINSKKRHPDGHHPSRVSPRVPRVVELALTS